MRRITQLLVAAVPGDAVTNAALDLHGALSGRVDSAVHAVHIDARLADVVRPLADVAPGGDPDDHVLVLHLSIGEPWLFEWLDGRRERLVVVYHNISPAEAFSAHDEGFAALLTAGRQSLAHLAHRTELALADSAYNAAELEALGYPVVHVSPLVFDPYRLVDVPGHPGTARHLEEAVTGPVVLYVGQILPHKRPDWLLQAYYALVTYLLPDAHLIMVGAGRIPHYATTVQVYADELNVTGAWLTGHVDDDVLASFYRRADVFATASEHEGFCAPVVEAMAFGLPVVARAFGALPETIGPAGVVVAPDDPPELFAEVLAAVIEDRALADELVVAGRARAGHFAAGRSRAAMVDRLLALA